MCQETSGGRKIVVRVGDNSNFYITIDIVAKLLADREGLVNEISMIVLLRK